MSDIADMRLRVHMHSPCNIRFETEKPLSWPQDELMFSYGLTCIQATLGDFTIPVTAEMMLELCLLAVRSPHKVQL